MTWVPARVGDGERRDVQTWPLNRQWSLMTFIISFIPVILQVGVQRSQVLLWLTLAIVWNTSNDGGFFVSMSNLFLMVL